MFLMIDFIFFLQFLIIKKNMIAVYSELISDVSSSHGFPAEGAIHTTHVWTFNVMLALAVALVADR